MREIRGSNGEILIIQEQKTLRDEFAMAALTGYLAKFGSPDDEFLIKACWYLADAMLEARIQDADYPMTGEHKAVTYPAGDHLVPAFTSSELMEILPDQLEFTDGDSSVYPMLTVEKMGDYYDACYPFNNADFVHPQRSKSLADALALLLIHLIENGYYDTKDFKPRRD